MGNTQRCLHLTFPHLFGNRRYASRAVTKYSDSRRGCLTPFRPQHPVFISRNRLLLLETSCYIYKPPSFYMYKPRGFHIYKPCSLRDLDLYELPSSTILSSRPKATTCS